MKEDQAREPRTEAVGKGWGRGQGGLGGTFLEDCTLVGTLTPAVDLRWRLSHR